MRRKTLKANNSYESEGSSASSNSSSIDGHKHRESLGEVHDIRDILLPRPEEIREDSGIYNGKNDDFLSSGEEFFEGFTYSQINEEHRGNFKKKGKRLTLTKRNNQLDILELRNGNNERLKVWNHPVYSSQESDFAGYTNSQICCPLYDKNKGTNDLNSANNIEYISPLKSNSSQKKLDQSVETKFSSNSTRQATPEYIKNAVFGIVSDENSCNAVDIKLLNDNAKIDELTSDLSFNGKITNITNTTKHDENLVLNTSACTPPLFEDEDLEESEVKSIPLTSVYIEPDPIHSSGILQNETNMLQRIKDSLCGVPPPPSFTISQLNLFKEIATRKQDIMNFFENSSQPKVSGDLFETGCNRNILAKPTHSMEDLENVQWPDILKVKYHGVCYNLSTVTEKIELLCLAVVDRYIGAETSSSFNIHSSPSSAKKRNMRQKMLPQSPGSRLSHLAKRRAVFSSANLQISQTSKSTSNTSKVNGRQILLNPKKSENRRKSKIMTPKRRTPGRPKFGRRTPSSRKKLIFPDDKPKAGPSRESSKRALFQSPPQQKILSAKMSIKPQIANRAEKSKRVLFSPIKSQDSCSTLDRWSQELTEPFKKENHKRKRSDDEVLGNSQKIFCGSENLTPRALKIKSQSFCDVPSTSASMGTISGKSLFRTKSDITTTSSSQLTEIQKKKLLWAVSQALQKKQIGVNHESFKMHASVLARVVKRFFLECTHDVGGTNQRMLRIANKYIFDVMQGKSADEIYLCEKAKLEHEKCMTKLTGYITPEVYENRKNILKKLSSTSLYSENSLDPFNFTHSSMNFSQRTQSTEFLNQISNESQAIREKEEDSATKLSIQTDQSLQNSSSKSNLHGIALRENVDCEQRKSAQKNFTGKDQKNISPYNDKLPSNYKKYSSIFLDINAAKAKRQISFDN